MIKFFVLAAGYGKRARPLSLIKPKPLFPVCGVPLIQLLLEQLRKKGLTSGFINLFYKPEEIVNAVKNRQPITFLHENRLSGSKILKKASTSLDDSLLLVINGDIYADIPVMEMMEKIDKSGSDGILMVRENKNARYSSLKYEKDIYRGIDHLSHEGIMYTGVALFRPHVVKEIKETSFFQTLDKSDFDIRIHFYNGIWLDIGDPYSYFQANFAYWRYCRIKGTNGSNILSENVKISGDSRVENTIIWENTTIKNHSLIKNSIITGNINLDGANFLQKIITNSKVYEL